MKINPLGNSNMINTYNKVAKPPAPEKPFETAAPTDQVTFSQEAMTYSSTISKIKEALEVRSPEETARVEDIKARVQDGTYEIDAEAVAEKIINDFILQK